MDDATRRDLLSSHNSYHTLTSQLGENSDDSNVDAGPRTLSLAVVRARAARRTEFAEQVLAASKAALEATDAVLAASDDLLAAPDLRLSTNTNSTDEAGSSAENRIDSHDDGAAVAATPDACEASDDSETEYTQSSHDIYALISIKSPKSEQEKEKEQPPQKQVAQQVLKTPPSLPLLSNFSDPPIEAAAENNNNKQDEEDSGSSSGSESSSSSSSSCEGEEDPSTSSHVDSTCAGPSSGRDTSVEFLLKGRESPGGLAELPISASLLAGSFEPKVPIPEFITSLATPGEEQSSTILSPTLQPADSGEDHEDSSSDNSEESSSSSSSSSSSNDETSKDDSTAEQDPQLEQQQAGKSQQPAAAIPNNASLQIQKPLLPTGPSVAADVPKVSQAPIQVQNPAIAAMLAKTPMPVPIAARIVPSTTATGEMPLNLKAPHVDENASSSEASDSEDDSDDIESDSGRPSIGDAPSENPSDTTGRSGSSDIENDDYVQELLSELKETKNGPASIPATRMPVATGHSGNVTMASQVTIGTPKPAKNAASSLASLLPAQDGDSDDDSDSEDAGEDSDDSSEEGSSEVSSSDDEVTGSQGEEDDEYVDELLKELHATKPSSLLPEQKIPLPIPTKPVVKASKMVNGLPATTVMTDSSASDDDISDMEPSSSSEWDSSDSELFSSDDEDSDDEKDSDDDGKETSGDAGDAHTVSDDGTSEEEEDDNYVDNLLNELQAPRPAPPQKPAPIPAMPPVLPAGLPAMPQGLAALASPLPGEGLNLANIRAELEKVGRAVMTQKSGEAFVARAQILASINQLSSHVPNCVLDFLGKEVKANISRKKAKKDKPAKPPKKGMVDMVSEDDAMSEVSALSEIDISEKDAGSNGKFLIDTSAMDHGDDGNTAVSSKMEKAPPRDLMRQKSSEALDKMFKEDCSNANMSADLVIDDDIEHIFNASNEYGLTTGRANRSTMSASIASSGTSNSGNRNHKSRSRATSVATMSWGSNLEGRLPSVLKFECSLLFIDISGFTKLSTLLDPETLSKVNFGNLTIYLRSSQSFAYMREFISTSFIWV